MNAPGWLRPRNLFALLAVLYIGISVWTIQRAPATGDEVGYVMAADALRHGEGLELTARWRVVDDADYSPGEPIAENEFIRITAPSRARAGNYPLHDVAFSLLILPAYAAGGRPAAVALVALAMAGAVVLGARAAHGLGASRERALAGGLVTGLSVPALTYSGQLFPDAGAPLFVALAVAAFAGVVPRAVGPLAIAMLPLLHVRFWPIAGCLGLALLATGRFRLTLKDLALLAGPTAVAVAGLSLLDLAVYGVPLPHAGWLLFFQDRREQIETYAGAHGIAGLFIDRAFGLLPAAPIAALLFFGAGAAMRRPAERALVLAAVPYLVLVPFVDWTGGWSPQARYFAPLVPLFPLLYARALEASRPLLVVAGVLVVWTAGQSAIYAAAPWLRYNFFTVAPQADKGWARIGVPSPSGLFPSFGTDAALPLALGWGVILVAIFGLGLRRGGQAK